MTDPNTSATREAATGAVDLSAGPVVKICGLTRLEDVVAARDLGVWALGFVFAPSPRRLEPDAARGLLDAAGLAKRARLRRDPGSRGAEPLTVGVFTDARAEEIARVAAEVGLDAVQLHGLAGPSAGEVAAALGGPERGVLIIQALSVGADECDADGLRRGIARARTVADIVLLDTKVASRAGQGPAGADAWFGGSGEAFRWPLAREAVPAAETVPLLVAGGIGPDNVGRALSESGAWGVDVSSGVEVSPGIKDARMMERLVARVMEGTAK
jgi:phosphoribosylanthranilate isomerase